MRNNCSPHLSTRGPAAERQWTADRARKTVSGLHGSAVLAQCGSADVGPIKYGRACPVPRRRGRPGGGPLWEFEIGPPLGQQDIAVWDVLCFGVTMVEVKKRCGVQVAFLPLNDY